jgi:hypothetical protein
MAPAWISIHNVFCGLTDATCKHNKKTAPDMVVFPERFGQHLEQTLDMLVVRAPEDKAAIFGQLQAWDGKGMFNPEVERVIQGTQ